MDGLNMRIGPWTQEKNASINATSINILVVTKRKCADNSIKLTHLMPPKLGASYSKADRNAKENGHLHPLISSLLRDCADFGRVLLVTLIQCNAQVSWTMNVFVSYRCLQGVLHSVQGEYKCKSTTQCSLPPCPSPWLCRSTSDKKTRCTVPRLFRIDSKIFGRAKY